MSNLPRPLRLYSGCTFREYTLALEILSLNKIITSDDTVLNRYNQYERLALNKDI